MESARIGHPFHQLLRTARPVNPAPLPRKAKAARKTGSNGFSSVNGPNAVAGRAGGAEPWDSAERETGARLPGSGLEQRGPLARIAVLCFFIAIVFLTGMFLGASLIANLPTPADSGTAASIPLPPEKPVAQSPTTADHTPPPAMAQPAPADAASPDAAPAPADSANASAEAAPAAPDPTGPAMPAEPAASPPAPGAPVPARPGLSDSEKAALLSRGDAFLGAGDVTSARLFYQRSADAGDGIAALRLGETFDAAFLERAHLDRVPGDLARAVSWYRQARDLGNPEAEILLKSLHAD